MTKDDLQSEISIHKKGRKKPTKNGIGKAFNVFKCRLRRSLNADWWSYLIHQLTEFEVFDLSWQSFDFVVQWRRRSHVFETIHFETCCRNQWNEHWVWSTSFYLDCFRLLNWWKRRFAKLIEFLTAIDICREIHHRRRRVFPIKSSINVTFIVSMLKGTFLFYSTRTTTAEIWLVSFFFLPRWFFFFDLFVVIIDGFEENIEDDDLIIVALWCCWQQWRQRVLNNKKKIWCVFWLHTLLHTHTHTHTCA
jgi:hypothetical protein